MSKRGKRKPVVAVPETQSCANNGLRVQVKDRVQIRDEFNEEVTYQIVDSEDNDPQAGKISNESPWGAALMGSCKGDWVEIKTPGGMITIQVLEIVRDQPERL